MVHTNYKIVKTLRQLRGSYVAESRGKTVTL